MSDCHLAVLNIPAAGHETDTNAPILLQHPWQRLPTCRDREIMLPCPLPCPLYIAARLGAALKVSLPAAYRPTLATAVSPLEAGPVGRTAFRLALTTR